MYNFATIEIIGLVSAIITILTGLISLISFIKKRKKKKVIVYSKNKNLLQNQNILKFGNYPQRLVTDKEELKKINKNLKLYNIKKSDFKGLVFDKQLLPYMFYIDIDINNQKYRGVYFNRYITNQIQNYNSDETCYQFLNNFSKEKIYWFKFEPILWYIISEKNNKIMLVSVMALDSKEFNDTHIDYIEGNKITYPNDYLNSSLRRWLINDFYNTALSENEKERLLKLNSLNDKISILDSNDLLILKNNQLITEASDYAKIKGSYVQKDPTGHLLPNTAWWYIGNSNLSDKAHYVSREGEYGNYIDDVTCTDGGIKLIINIK